MFEVAVSVSLVLECEDALIRHAPESGLNDKDVREMIDYVCAVAVRQDVFFLWRPFLSDANDDLVLEVAAAARCDAILTHNVRDFRGAEKLGLRILSPGQFLQELRGPIWVH